MQEETEVLRNQLQSSTSRNLLEDSTSTHSPSNDSHNAHVSGNAGASAGSIQEEENIRTANNSILTQPSIQTTATLPRDLDGIHFEPHLIDELFEVYVLVFGSIGLQPQLIH